MKTTPAPGHLGTWAPPLWYPPILTYHRVHPTPDSKTPTLSPEIFARQMAILASRWRPISLRTLVQHLEENRPLPHRSVGVTFDDGTEDIFTYAFPALQKYGVPATLFLIAGNIGQPGFLNRDQIQAMRGSLIEFGSHGLTHEYLPHLPLARAEESLSISQALIRQVTEAPVEFLSYPAGGYTPELIRVARALGYRAACTTNRGSCRFPLDRWAIRRISMHGRTCSRLGLWIRCSGYYGLNRRLRPPC